MTEDQKQANAAEIARRQAQETANDAAELAKFRELKSANPFEAAWHYRTHGAAIHRAMNAELQSNTPLEVA